MKKIYDYVQNINEGRPKGVKNKPKGDEPAPDLNKVTGQSEEDNGSGGLYSVDFFDDDEDPEPLEKDKLNKNMKRLLMKFKAEEDFFIQGEAGWGKTTIIKDMAKRFKRHVITVYLDKAVATDLGGIPVPVKGKSGATQELAMPAWAKIMDDNPDKKFLLFFDEMNQAQPDVMNALMPIVLEHEVCGRKFGPLEDTGKKDKNGQPIMKVKESNFFVGAAGNFEKENGAVNELSGPLKSRFKPIIIWETGTPEGWKAAFDFMRKKWDNKETKDLINILEDNCNLFINPREVEQKVIKHAVKLKQAGDTDIFDTDDFKDRLEGLVKEKLSPSEEDAVNEIAEALYDFVSGHSSKKGRAAETDISMLDPNFIKQIKSGMQKGFIHDPDDNVKYGISRESIFDCDIDETTLNKEMLERLIAKLEADGVEFKYETDADWQKEHKDWHKVTDEIKK